MDGWPEDEPSGSVPSFVGVSAEVASSEVASSEVASSEVAFGVAESSASVLQSSHPSQAASPSQPRVSVSALVSVSVGTDRLSVDFERHQPVPGALSEQPTKKADPKNSVMAAIVNFGMVTFLFRIESVIF